MQKLDTILLIDDDNIANYLNQDLISSLRIAYSIPIANNGKEGLDYVKKVILKKKYSLSGLILLDLQMPVMDGFEFLAHFKDLLQKTKHNLKLAILTADQQVAKKNIKDHSAYTYLQKPLTEDKMLNLLKNLDKTDFTTAVPVFN